jgi:hypothetical protein
MMGISSSEPDVNCPDCRRLMIRLDNYELAIDAHGPDAAGGGFMPVTRATVGFLMLDGLLNLLFAWRHRVKSRQVCQRFLNDWPNSMVCPACLFVYKRR